jgi:NlpC/P60 family
MGIGCKHTQKNVNGSEKKVVKKTETVKKPVEQAPKGDASAEWILQEKLGLSDKQIKNSKFYSFITEWYGMPYKYGGCQKTGVDCSCFTNILYEKVYGKTLLRTANDMFEQSEKIAVDAAHEGDLVFFKINSHKITHVGVLLKSDLFIHSSTSKGVVISSIKEAYYQKYFFCAGRVKKL